MVGIADSEPGKSLRNQLEPDRWRKRAREIRDLCRQIADVRARDELQKIAAEYELIAESVRFVHKAQLDSEE
jgi:hypothetical protein